MLLPMFLVTILASANAGLLDTAIAAIPKLDPLERIPDVSHLLTPTFPEDAELTTVSKIPAFFYYSLIKPSTKRIKHEFKKIENPCRTVG